MKVLHRRLRPMRQPRRPPAGLPLFTHFLPGHPFSNRLLVALDFLVPRCSLRWTSSRRGASPRRALSLAAALKTGRGHRGAETRAEHDPRTKESVDMVGYG
jgi:hypothetical protein